MSGHKGSVSERALVENEVADSPITETPNIGLSDNRYAPLSDNNDPVYFKQSGGGGGVDWPSPLAGRTSMERMLMLVIVILCTLLFILSIAFAVSTSHVIGRGRDKPDMCVTPTCVRVAGEILAKMNQSVDPCDDFYTYSCGRWVSETLPPNGFGIWNFFQELQNQVKLKTKKIFDDWATRQDELLDSQLKSLIFYKSCLSEDNRRETLGIAPLLELLQRLFTNSTMYGADDAVAAIPFEESDRAIAWQFGFTAVYDYQVFPKNTNTSEHILSIGPRSELPLGTPANYKNLTGNGTEHHLLAAYRYAIVEVFTHLAHKQGHVLTPEVTQTIHAQADKLIALEIDYASIVTDVDDMQMKPVEETYTETTLTNLKDMVPSVDWAGVFSQFSTVGVTISPDEPVQLFDPDFFHKVESFIQRSSNEVLHNYMYWLVSLSALESLTHDLASIQSNLTAQIRGSNSGARPRWEQCVDSASDDERIGNVIGATFIQTYFDGASMKTRIQSMIDSVRDAFIHTLPSLTWLDAKTRGLAERKAEKMQDFFAFPDTLLNETYVGEMLRDLKVDEEQWFNNELNMLNFSRSADMRRLRQPVNKAKWEMTPQTINAYYAPASNSITFPAGIFQKPFYSAEFPMSFNYGGIGVVFGHELTHGFDTQGRMYDENGDQKQWFTNETSDSYLDLANCFIEQYNGYELFGMHVDGVLTLGENIADNGGIKSSYKAYKAFAAQAGGPEPRYPGLEHMSDDQMFFLAFGQMWCNIQNEEYVRYRLKSDYHTPEKFRVPGAVSNLKEFAQAFHCKTDTPMNPKDKCQIW